jgi:glycosyltransferase involved in cell wall biosynthesis
MGIVQDTVVVVPCYNEAKRLKVDEFRRELASEPRLRFVLVNDGSRDATLERLSEIAREFPERAAVLDLQPNRGKAEAVRQGMLRAFELGPELVGYWDADLATPLHVIGPFSEKFTDPELLLVLGSRVRMLGRNIERSAFRHYLGRVLATIAAGTLRLPTYDTQCGAKLFRLTPVTREVFKRPFSLGWFFDVEVLARLLGLEARGLCNVERQCFEFPLDTWLDAPGSKLNLRQVPKVFGELVKLQAIVREERRRR